MMEKLSIASPDVVPVSLSVPLSDEVFPSIPSGYDQPPSQELVKYLNSFLLVAQKQGMAPPASVSPDDEDDGVFLQWDTISTTITLHLCHQDGGSIHGGSIHGRIVVVRESETTREIEILMNAELN